MARYPGVEENDFITLSLREIELVFVLNDSGEDCVLSIDEDGGSAESHVSGRSVAPCRVVSTDSLMDWIRGISSCT